MVMTYKRSHLIDPSGGTYHVCSRCVRKSFLFGIDSSTGKDLSHRREWIEQRIVELSGVFSISVYAYSIMSNHYHLILNVEQEDISDDEVVDRWLQLCPGRAALQEKEGGLAAQRMALLEDPLRMLVIRARLVSVSWFMRFLNEPLARMANREDDCTGRFWEGRFKSQALLDEASILACMVYVDLNPIRAGLTESLDESDFTSIKQRLSTGNFTDSLATVGQQKGMTSISPINLDTYLELILWTESSSQGKSRGLSSRILQCLKHNHTSVNCWFQDHLPQPGTWQRAVGSAINMNVYAVSNKQRWIRRRSGARLHS
jgi:putative transposase